MRLSAVFSNVESVVRFTKVCEKLPFNVNAFAGDYHVNAKSLMGLLYLCTEGPVELRFECSKKDAAEIVNQLSIIDGVLFGEMKEE